MSVGFRVHSLFWEVWVCRFVNEWIGLEVEGHVGSRHIQCTLIDYKVTQTNQPLFLHLIYLLEILEL